MEPVSGWCPPVRVNFVAGLDVHAPGVSRAQEPLIEALSQKHAYEIRPVKFSLMQQRLWFPVVYGVMPAWLAIHRAPLVHVGNAWYAHLVPLLRSPSIVTCHDLIELDQAHSGSRHFRPHRRFHLENAFRGMQGARFIVCVSRATADRVVACAPACEERVRVIHSGLAPIFRPGTPDSETLRRLGVEEPYVLYVGSEQERKNLVRLVAGVAIARRQIPDLHLVKVGEAQTASGRSELLNAIDREGMQRSTLFLDRVTDGELRALYAGAVATVLVSLDEGFGFPALEAMACGCPAIVSSTPALMEITGGVALTVDPLDAGSIASAIERVVGHAVLRADLAERGSARAAQFTWARAADAYTALYEEALATE